MKSEVEQRKKETKHPFFRNILQGQPTLRNPSMAKTMGKNTHKQPIQCWSFGTDHMYIYFPQRGDKVSTAHSVQQAVTIEDMGRNVPRIYTAMDNKKFEF
jgi:hypothetical protein